MEKLITDRIEEGIAVLEKEDGTHIEIPAENFEFNIREGDILIFDGEKYIRSEDEATQKRAKMLALQKKLSQKSKKQ